MDAFILLGSAAVSIGGPIYWAGTSHHTGFFGFVSTLGAGLVSGFVAGRLCACIKEGGLPFGGACSPGGVVPPEVLTIPLSLIVATCAATFVALT